MKVYVVERIVNGESTLLGRGRADREALLQELKDSLVSTAASPNGTDQTQVGSDQLRYEVHEIEIPEVEWIQQLVIDNWRVLG